MDRRQFNSTAGRSVAALIGMAYAHAHALSLGDLTNAEASQGLKTALEKGALAAVAILGKTDGFWGNAKVRIPLPGFLDDAAKLLKTLGQGKRVDELLVQLLSSLRYERWLGVVPGEAPRPARHQFECN